MFAKVRTLGAKVAAAARRALKTMERSRREVVVIGRAIRYRSHAHLPEDQRRVRVMRYYSTLPKPLFGKGDAGIERYMQGMAKQKGGVHAGCEACQEKARQGNLGRGRMKQTREALEAARVLCRLVLCSPMPLGTVTVTVPPMHAQALALRPMLKELGLDPGKE